MNQRICSIALVGGLTLLFCIPLSAKTLYVADNGDNTDGSSWETAYTTIQSAVSAAQTGSVTDPNLVTIVVGSAGTGHGSGTYTNNIDISLAGLTLISESGFESTIIQAASSGDHVINITADYVTVCGFSIYGASTGGLTQYSGIALNGADNCLIENNRCGWSATTYQNARGMSLSSSNSNTVRNNLCTWNTGSGIYLASSQNNVITQNIFSQNGNYGIEMASGSNYNSVTLNSMQNNTNDGFYLNSATWNQIVSNITSGNRYGVNGVYSEHNSWYLNDFSRNNSSSFSLKYSPVSSGDFWVSPTPLCYGYSHSIYLNYMGNLYKEYAGADSDQNGIGDTEQPIKDGVVDPAPLADPNLSYTVQAWYLDDQGTMTMDPNQPGFWQPLTTGSSYVWLSNTPAKEEITFAALDADDGWNGQVRFNNTVANNFVIEVGFVDPNNGIFVGSGATAILSGTSSLLVFETSGQTFSVQAGKVLAVQITNNGATKQIYLGGAWSYITAPAGTDIPWPGTQEVPPEPPVNPGDLDGDGWVNMEDAAYLSLHWGLADCNDLNDYCQRADIDKSGNVGPGDLYLLATYWLMGPDELLAGDRNEDFKVNMDDAALLSSQWTGDLNQLVELCDNWLKGVPMVAQEKSMAGDWTGDLKVNMDDVAALSSQWTGDLNQLLPLCEHWLEGVF